MKFQMSFTLFFALFAILGNGKAMSEWNDNYQKQKAYNLDYLESYADELFKNFKESLLNKYKMLYEDIQEQENLTEPTPLEVDNVPEVYIVQNANKDVSGNSLISNSHFNKCQQDFQRQCIIAHNQYRSRHHSPPLMTDEDLQTSALNYAKTLAVKNAFEHSGQPGKGENLAYSWSSSVSSLSNCAAYADKYVKMWYDEINLYSFNHPGFSSATGHFTQVVWKSTMNLGCGIAISSDNKIYVVSQYTPPGNYNNEYRENVLPM